PEAVVALSRAARRRAAAVRAGAAARVARRRVVLARPQPLQRLLGRRGARRRRGKRVRGHSICAPERAAARVARLASPERRRRAQRRGAGSQDRSRRALRLGAPARRPRTLTRCSGQQVAPNYVLLFCCAASIALPRRRRVATTNFFRLSGLQKVSALGYSPLNLVQRDY